MTIDYADPAGNSTAIRNPPQESAAVFAVTYAQAQTPPWTDADCNSHGQAAASGLPHLIWADKVGLAAVIVIAVLSALACTAILLAADTMSFGRLNHLLAMWSGMAELSVALPIWLVMRGIDFAANGPAHRRVNRKRRFG